MAVSSPVSSRNTGPPATSSTAWPVSDSHSTVVGSRSRVRPVRDRAKATGDDTSTRCRTTGSHVVANRVGCPCQDSGSCRLQHAVDARDVRLVDEHGQPQSPVVVARRVVVEPEHVGPGPEPAMARGSPGTARSSSGSTTSAL